jgi:hypothetical protein
LHFHHLLLDLQHRILRNLALDIASRASGPASNGIDTSRRILRETLRSAIVRLQQVIDSSLSQ